MSYEGDLKVNTGYPLVNIDQFDKVPSSSSVTYTKLIPITDGFSNFSTSKILMQHNIHLTNKEEKMDVSEKQDDKDDCFIIEELVQHGIVDKDCVLLEGDDAESEIVISNQKPGTSNILNMEVSNDNQSRNSKRMLVNNEDVKETKKKSKYVNEEENTNYCENTATKEIDEHFIKTELPDEIYSYDTINSEVIIKEEPNDSTLVEEPSATSQSENSQPMQNLLNENPLVFTSFCGLPSISMFNALLQYVEDEMKTLKDVTKFEQLFSVLTKLHKNEDNLYLNKYIFPPAYVYTVEVLYKKLKLWRNKNFLDFSQIPKILTAEFGPIEEAAIIGIQTVHIRSKCPAFLNKVRSVKYVIGYTPFGEVFFVSKAFVGTIETVRLILDCGVLRNLPENQWIFFYNGGTLCATQNSKCYGTKASIKEVNRIVSDKAERYVTCVVSRLYDNFKVLHLIPDFMLKYNKKICFLDKLVFVCCMLLNMLPRPTYK